jgi:acetyltransferase-like isoleucine patch superfamily enzyme
MMPTSSPIRLIFNNLLGLPLFSRTYWCIHSLILLFSNRSKHLRIGKAVHIHNTTVGNNVTFYNNAHCYDSSIGAFSYIGARSRITNCSLGCFCSIAPEVLIGLGGTHPTDLVSTHPAFYSTLMQSGVTFVNSTLFDETSKQITIGHDVWIGTRAILVDGVSIGCGAIVAAAAVVTKDVPPYAIVAGVPAKVIRYRFSPTQIEFLLKFKWWDKSHEWLRDHSKYFCDIDSFIQTRNI